MNRRAFLKTCSAAAVALSAAPDSLRSLSPSAEPAVEWRNRQPGMAYRRLGRTNLMISEVLSGGDPIRTANCKHLETALELGLNYFDMAPAYGRGNCEEAYGLVLAGSAGRERVFLNTKISGFTDLRNKLYKDIFDGLPAGKQETITRRAEEMRRDRGVEKPGYFFEYFPNQGRAFEATYRSNAMMQDYRHRVEGSPEFRKFIVQSIEASLRRVGTDYFDIAMCPHGAHSPEEAQIQEVYETFALLKKQGKVRFLGVSSHNDPAGVLRAAAETGRYDVVMVAYNICNGGYVEEPIRNAAAKDVGVIGMKVAMAVATHHKALQPIPEWRVQKIQRIVPGDIKTPMKAYLWALQNPNISAVVSNLWDETYVRENLSLAGKKVELQPG